MTRTKATNIRPLFIWTRVRVWICGIYKTRGFWRNGCQEAQKQPQFVACHHNETMRNKTGYSNWINISSDSRVSEINIIQLRGLIFIYHCKRHWIHVREQNELNRKIYYSRNIDAYFGVSAMLRYMNWHVRVLLIGYRVQRKQIVLLLHRGK